MAYRQLEPISKQLTIVIGLTVVGFMAFGLALSFYRNILFEQTLKGIRDQNEHLRGKINQGYRDLEYYKSSQYKDKYAKENLGLVRPGEKVLIITENTIDPFLSSSGDLAPSEQQEAAYLEILRQMPIIEHWKIYLFSKERIEELKRGL